MARLFNVASNPVVGGHYKLHVMYAVVVPDLQEED